ncbi:hypothetical protein SDC9_129072 [bioreactor metagenome]|uniref:Uncharacterized protein n=1 Tax=bioreactor metagenome TaxID=1076179 RepID=A0A645CYI0_9ZZZZ
MNSQPEVPEKISDANSGYAYFGAALNGTGAASAASTTPLAFEKPSVRPDGRIVVLFLDGKVEVVNTKAKTCAEAAAELKKAIEKPNAQIWDAVEKTAKAIDSATE